MQTGIFRGIENGSMKIEYQSNPVTKPDEKRVFSYPVGGDRSRDAAFYGFGPNEGTIGFRPDLPAIGQTVGFSGPEPDMAGHLMVNVYSVEVA